MTSNKNKYWQFVRGLCIIAVVLMHCPSGLNYDVSSITYKAYFILRQFINFPVAVFIFMSGYFSKSADGSLLDYYKNRVLRLVVPFIIWSLFYTIISITQNIVAGLYVSWKYTIFNFIIGQASPPLYYIVVLVQLTILTPFLYKVIQKQNKILNCLLWLITPIYLILLYLYKIHLGSNGFPFNTLYAALFPAWFNFYWLGINVRNKKGVWYNRLRSIRGLELLVVFSIIVCMLESLIWIYGEYGAGFAVNQVRFSSFGYSFLLILLFSKHAIEYERTKSGKFNSGIFRLTSFLGDISYGIYFSHIFFLRIVMSVLELFSIQNDYWIYWILTFVLTMILSVLFISLMTFLSRINPKHMKCLGIR